MPKFLIGNEPCPRHKRYIYSYMGLSIFFPARVESRLVEIEGDHDVSNRLKSSLPSPISNNLLTSTTMSTTHWRWKWETQNAWCHVAGAFVGQSKVRSVVAPWSTVAASTCAPCYTCSRTSAPGPITMPLAASHASTKASILIFPTKTWLLCHYQTLHIILNPKPGCIIG